MTEETEDDGWITLYPPMDTLPRILKALYDSYAAVPYPQEWLDVLDRRDDA